MTLVKMLMFCTACLAVFMSWIGPSAAQWDHCQDSQGEVHLIPMDQKPVLVPIWLDPERIIIQTHVARNLKPNAVAVEPKKCNPDELAVSPSVCED